MKVMLRLESRDSIAPPSARAPRGHWGIGVGGADKVRLEICAEVVLNGHIGIPVSAVRSVLRQPSLRVINEEALVLSSGVSPQVMASGCP